MYIRGIGSRINNPAVGIYYDNIPLMSKAAFNHHFYHIDRVDVLRGPQGTLYGMNTEGGLVHIYSKNPMVYQGTDIAMGIGTGLTSHAEIAHFHRPSDKFAFSAAGFWNGQRGFFKNQALDEWNDHRPSDKFAFSAAGFWNGQRGFFKNQALDEWNDRKPVERCALYTSQPVD